MPITYHFRSRSPDSTDDLLSSPERESFPDDSIVLSDLIRTGETSRLRRRGAMRIEPSGTSSSSRYRRMRSPRHSDDTHPESPPHTWTIVENRHRHIPRHLPMLEVSDDDLELGDSDSDSGDEMVFSSPFHRAISEQPDQLMWNQSNSSRTRIASETDSEKLPVESTSYTLLCGGPLEIPAGLQSGTESIHHSAFSSFILPQPSQSSSSLPPTSPAVRDTNGCGAILHTRAFPRYRHHQPMWTANTSATEAVVPLEGMYFDDICAKEKLSPKVIKQEACGCLRIGIGCAYCGNPVGFRLTPCRILRDSISSRQSILRESRHVSKPDHDNSDLHLYSFFCSSTSSEKFSFPGAEYISSRWGDTSRTRNHPLLPPPPPLIRLMSDSESDTDEEVIIDFRAPNSSSLPPTVLGGGLAASPEPTVINLEPNPPLPIPSLLQPHSRNSSTENAEQYAELEEALAGWASVVRGAGVTTSSVIEDDAENSSLSPHIGTFRRSRGPERRNALGFDVEGELGFTSTNANESHNVSLNRDVSSVLFEDTSSLPEPEIEELPPSTSALEPNDAEQTTPRASVWGMSFADGYPSTSFWGRPEPGGSQWTWSNELAEAERERDREGNDQPVRVFDPDGEFLEGLDGEWGEDMARQLGFGSQEEKNDASETTTTSGLWWS